MSPWHPAGTLGKACRRPQERPRTTCFSRSSARHALALTVRDITPNESRIRHERIGPPRSLAGHTGACRTVIRGDAPPAPRRASGRQQLGPGVAHGASNQAPHPHAVAALVARGQPHPTVGPRPWCGRNQAQLVAPGDLRGCPRPRPPSHHARLVGPDRQRFTRRPLGLVAATTGRFDTIDTTNSLDGRREPSAPCPANHRKRLRHGSPPAGGSQQWRHRGCSQPGRGAATSPHAGPTGPRCPRRLGDGRHRLAANPRRASPPHQPTRVAHARRGAGFALGPAPTGSHHRWRSR